MLKLYENIKKRREALGMSQTKLAELTGYADKSTISRIESGKVDLAQSKIQLFAEALKTTSSDLMGYDLEEELDSRQTALIELMDAAEMCDEDTIRRLTAYLKFTKEYKDEAH